MSTEKTIAIAGENSLIVYFADKPQCGYLHSRLPRQSKSSRPTLGTTLIDLVPSYASLLVIFDPV